MVFGNYAKYYDLLYKDKDYEREADYVASLINKFSTLQDRSVLEIGCGTGKHAELLVNRGYQVDGVDRSQDMISIAKKRKRDNLNFFLGDGTGFDLSRQYSTAISLFHVVSYQVSNEALLGFFNSVSRHLVPGGLFVFDVWYGPAVLHEMPAVRIKRMADQQIDVTRLCEPVVLANQNRVDVNYEVFIKDAAGGQFEVLKETHQMRYLFVPELDLALHESSMVRIHAEEWLTGKEPGLNSWGVCFVARKNADSK